MSDSTGYVVPAGLMGALGALWGAVPTAISPLRHPAGDPLTDEERATLVGAGVLDASGSLTPGVRPALDVLGSATAFTRVYISGGLAPYEYLVFFAPSGASASIVNAGGDMSIASPAHAEEFLAMIGESLGLSSFVAAPFEATLEPAEAIVLSALLDAQRRESLTAILEGRDPEAVELTPAALGTLVAKSGTDREWLVDVLFELTGSDGIDADGVATAIASLESAGLVAKAGKRLRLTGNLLLLGQRLLVLDSALTLTSGALAASGEVAVAGFTCLQAGVHDLLSIDAREGEVELRSVSAAEVGEYARAFLTDASVVDALRTGTGAPQKAAAKAAAFCTGCGAKLAPGAAFCTKCGKQVG